MTKKDERKKKDNRMEINKMIIKGIGMKEVCRV